MVAIQQGSGISHFTENYRRNPEPHPGNGKETRKLHDFIVTRISRLRLNHISHFFLYCGLGDLLISMWRTTIPIPLPPPSVQGYFITTTPSPLVIVSTTADFSAFQANGAAFPFRVTEGGKLSRESSYSS